MAIAPTGALYKSLTFDGEDSRNYGVYITGEAVYNAPERAMEMVSIPNRNGAFAIDKGYFENIEVTYPAGAFADTETDFAEAISNFRNALCSRRGYVRLSDEYNPNEYRMALYKNGLDVSPAQLKAGEFSLTFDCKPQRWLTSGETEITVSDGDTLTNPTLFESSPLLAFKGYGTIGFNGYTVELDTIYIGDIDIPYTKNSTTYTLTDVSDLNSGDQITIKNLGLTVERFYSSESSVHVYGRPRCTGWRGCYSEAYAVSNIRQMICTTSFPPISLQYGTSWTGTVASSVTVLLSSPTRVMTTDTITFSYDGDATITISTLCQQDPASPAPTSISVFGNSPAITAFSTKPYNKVVYCDCDLGEFYKIEDGAVISMNYLGDLGSDLPKLAIGDNTITKSNTITELKIVPRWWKV